MKTRKQEYAEQTKAALLDAAGELFATKGYTGTSIENIVRSARVTRGALYHHYSSKEAIFVAAYRKTMSLLMDNILTAVNSVNDPWDKALVGCRTFLDHSVNPGFKIIRIQDAIAALGWQRWREIDAGYTMKVLKEIVKSLVDTGVFSIHTLDYSANLIHAMLVEASLNIVQAHDKKAAHAEMLSIIEKMLRGLRF